MVDIQDSSLVVWKGWMGGLVGLTSLFDMTMFVYDIMNLDFSSLENEPQPSVLGASDQGEVFFFLLVETGSDEQRLDSPE